jgi:hypothetical protein
VEAETLFERELLAKFQSSNTPIAVYVDWSADHTTKALLIKREKERVKNGSQLNKASEESRNERDGI